MTRDIGMVFKLSGLLVVSGMCEEGKYEKWKAEKKIRNKGFNKEEINNVVKFEIGFEEGNDVVRKMKRILDEGRFFPGFVDEQNVNYSKHGPAIFSDSKVSSFVISTMKEWKGCDCCKVVCVMDKYGLRCNSGSGHLNLPADALLCEACYRHNITNKNEEIRKWKFSVCKIANIFCEWKMAGKYILELQKFEYFAKRVCP